MMAPERLKILHTAFHTAKQKDSYGRNNITPAPKSFASCLLLGKQSQKEILRQEDQGFSLASSAKSCTYCPPKMGSGYSGKNGLPA